jgi:hypothetical protein
MFNWRARALFIILTALFPILPQAMAQEDGRFGAEIELSARHLSVFAAQADFSDLQKRFSFAVQPQKVGLQTDRDFIEEYAPLLGRVTQDLPLMMTDFLENISSQLRQQWIAEFGEPPRLQTGLAALEKEREKAFAQMQSAKTLVLPQGSSLQSLESSNLATPKSIIGSQGQPKIIVNEHSGEVASYSKYWTQVNERWNRLSPETRIEQISSWESLPASSRAALLVYLYTIGTNKKYGPDTKGFRSDVLDLKFKNDQMAELYSRFYPSRDALGIVEYHTLEPSGRVSFFEELKRFLKFTGAERQVLFPGLAQRRDVGLHIHYSSPRFRNFDMEKFVTSYKVMMTYRALSKGDLSVLVHSPAVSVQNNTFSADPQSRDLMALRGSDRVEMRYFSENVEEEMRELEKASEMGFKEALAYLKAETSKVIKDNMVRLALEARKNADVMALLDFSIWPNLELSPATRLALSDHFKLFPSHLLTMVQNALNQDVKISSSQLGLIEAAIDSGLRNPISTRARELYLVNVLKLVQMGLVFESQLGGYANRDHFDPAIVGFIDKMLSASLDAYLARVEMALEAFKERRNGLLEDYVQPRQLLVFDLTFISGSNPALQKVILSFLRNPANHQKLSKAQVLPELVAALSKGPRGFSRKYFDDLREALKGSSAANKMTCAKALSR